MAAAKYDFTIEQGATFTKTLTIKDSSAALVDLTGQTFRGQIRKVAGGVDLLATFTCVVSDQITNKGEVVISLTATDTSAIPITTQAKAVRKLDVYAYDVERVTGSNVDRILEGEVSISPEVTV